MAVHSDEDYSESTDWYILECRGCGRVFVQAVSKNSEDYEMYYEEDGSEKYRSLDTIKYWPALSKRNKPEWMSAFGIEAENTHALVLVMTELYGALDNDLHILAAIGIRTAYDIASELLGVDQNLTFREKLDKLIDAGLIGVVDKDRIEMMIDAGNASAHRGWRPKPSDLKIIMDILEHFINESFMAPARKKKLNDEAIKIKENVPLRTRKLKK